MQIKEEKNKTEKSGGDQTIFYILLTLLLMLVIIVAIIPMGFMYLSRYDATDVQWDIPNKANPAVSAQVEVERKIYRGGDTLLLRVYNQGRESLFLEPCEKIGKWQQMKEGEWKEEIKEPTVSEDSAANLQGQKDFAVERSNTSCKLSVPSGLESGIYRLIVPIYFGCINPDPATCARMEDFYTTSFEVQRMVPGGAVR